MTTNGKSSESSGVIECEATKIDFPVFFVPNGAGHLHDHGNPCSRLTCYHDNFNSSERIQSLDLSAVHM